MNCIKKAVAVLCCLLCVVTAIVPVSAASSSVSDTYITLDDGSRLFVPSDAIDGSYIIVRQTGRQIGSLIIEKTRYVIYSFDGWIGSGFGGGDRDITDTTPSVTEGDKHDFMMYKTDYFVSDFDALAADNWSYDTYTSDNFSVSGDIVYSTVNYYDSDGNLVYASSYDVQVDVDEPTLGDYLTISPVRDYTGLLPSLSTVSFNYKTDNWMMIRKPLTSSYEVDDNGIPIYTSDTQWRYLLLYFTDDFTVDFVPTMTYEEGTENEKLTDPVLRIVAGAVFVSDLYLPNLSSYSYFPDATLDSVGALSRWGSFETYDSGYTIAFSDLASDNYRTDATAFQNELSNMLIACSFPITKGVTGPWYIDGTADATTFYTPAFEWDAVVFDFADSTPDADTEEDGVISWLQKIYNGMISGFERVIEAIGLGGGSDTSVDDVPDADENINPDNEDENGFSITDIFGSLWDFLKKIFGGFWKLISGILGGITGFIGDFFDLVTDNTSDLFDIFDDKEPTEGEEAGAWYYIGNFFAFLQNLWLCIPSPIKALIYVSFVIMVVFGLLKMFH